MSAPGWEKIIGVYECGFEQVQLVLRSGTGGEFYFIPEEGALPRLKVGADHRMWREVVSALLHEVVEFQLTRLRCRWNPSQDMGLDHSAYLFVADHPTFSDVMAKSAEFLAAAWEPLKAEWRKRRKKR